jgi:uncharacterized membrane protein YgcG
MPGLPIKVTCECKHRFRARARLARRMVKCPNCETALAIPPLSSDMVSADGQKWEACPECAGPFLAKAEVCENCSYSRRTAEIQKSKDTTFWYRLVPFVLIAAVLAYLVQTQLKGVEFLWFFVFFALCGGTTTIGAEFHDLGKFRTFVAWAIAFEIVGVVRILFGTSIGMTQFDFLKMMMVGCPFLGAIFLFGKSNNSDNSGWFFGSSCGSSCGGGGCGGGCGGCGGGD